MTPVNDDFLSFNRAFPMGVKRYSSSTSGTDAGNLNDHHKKNWFASTEEEEEDEDRFDVRTPTGRGVSLDGGILGGKMRARTPSLVDELLSEIYARFGDSSSVSSSHRRLFSGDTTTTTTSSASFRASQSGSPDSDDCLTEYSTTSEAVVRD